MLEQQDHWKLQKKDDKFNLNLIFILAQHATFSTFSLVNTFCFCVLVQELKGV